MKIKLDSIKTNNTKELSVLSQYDELVVRKTNELIKKQNTALLSQHMELVFFFDKSGSVEGTEPSMIKYLINIINKYKKQDINILFTLIVFSDSDEVLYYRKPLNEIKDIYYSANGGTSLYDSLCRNIALLLEEHENINSISSKTLITIMTDGFDTTSRNHDEKAVEKIVKYTKSLGWEYIFLKPKSEIQEMEYLGIDHTHIGMYDDKVSLSHCFKAIEKAIDSYIKDGKVYEDWKEELNSKTLRLTYKGD